MALEVAAGGFTLPTTLGATVTVSGLTFAPKAVFLWCAGHAVGSDTPVGTAAASARPGWGFFTSTTERVACGAFIQDATNPANTICVVRSDAAFVQLAGASYAAYDVQSMNSDGFTLVNENAASQALRVHYLAWGGSDLTHVKCGQLTVNTGTGSESLTGVGFDADCVLFIDALGTTNVIQNTLACLALGVATGSGSQQWALTGISYDNVIGSSATSYLRGGECYTTAHETTAGATKYRFSLTSFDSDGFTINKASMPNANAVPYLALKGCSAKAGTLTLNNAGGSVTGLGFVPKALLMATHGKAENTAGSMDAQHLISIGAATGAAARRCQVVRDVNAANPTNVLMGVRDDAVLAVPTTSSTYTVDGLVDLTSFDSDGFTYAVDDTFASPPFAGYLAFGDAPSAPTGYAHSQVFMIG